MNKHRWRHVSSIALVLVLAACAATPPSTIPEVSVSVAPSDTPATATPTFTATAAPSTSSGPLGGGRLLVYQLDDTPAGKAVMESVFTLDLGTGERTKIGSMPQPKDGVCCPDIIRVSVDRSRAFLWTGRYRASVDVAAKTVTPAPRWMAQLFSQGSSKGDRLAWVDTLTGAAETIVIGDLKARELSRLSLPTGAWGSTVAWSPDDTSLAVTTLRPLAVALAGLGTSIIACCSIDHGVSASHLLIVPVDGSAIRDLLDDASEVAQDEAEPMPTAQPGGNGVYASKAERWLSPAVWSADGRTILLTSTVCEATYDKWHHARDCNSSLSLVDVETGTQTLLREGTGTINAADLSPDGRHVAFVSETGGEEGQLSVVDRDGHNPRILGPAFAGLVDWSPDGTWLAFWRQGDAGPENGDRFDVWAMPLDGGAPLLVAEHASAGW